MRVVIPLTFLFTQKGASISRIIFLIISESDASRDQTRAVQRVPYECMEVWKYRSHIVYQSANKD